MNNNKLLNIIEKYGGNDDPNIYTNSLLNKYKQKNDLVINKINNLEILLVDPDDYNQLEAFDSQNGGNYEKYDFKNLVKMMK